MTQLQISFPEAREAPASAFRADWRDRPHQLLETVLQPLVQDDARQLARRLLSEHQSLSRILNRASTMPASALGLSEPTRAYLADLHTLFGEVARPAPGSPLQLNSWAKAINYLQMLMQDAADEEVRIIFLDRKNCFLGQKLLGRGTIAHAEVYPRTVVREALYQNASGALLAHNHPSGDPTPSQGDITMTKEILAAFKPVDIVLHDHIILGRGCNVSMKTLGLI